MTAEQFGIGTIVILLVLCLGMLCYPRDYYVGPNLSQKHRLAYGGVAMHAQSIDTQSGQEHPQSLIVPNHMPSLRHIQKGSIIPQENLTVTEGSKSSDMSLDKLRKRNARGASKPPSMTATRGLQVRSKGRVSYN